MLKLVLEIECSDALKQTNQQIDIIDRFILPNFKRKEENPKKLPVIYTYRYRTRHAMEPLITIRIIEAVRTNKTL